MIPCSRPLGLALLAATLMAAVSVSFAASLNVSPAESTAELVNPMRGYFKWRGKWVVPQPSAPLDSYDRLYWTQLEGSTQGSYNMQPIYDGIAAAKAAGGPKAKYAFRIRAMGGAKENGTFVPQYVRNLMPNGWYNTYNSNTMYVPDWNDSDFIARYNALLLRVAQEFDGSPDIAYIDIGTYGCWGEWHVSGLTYPHGSATAATTATLQAYVDGYVNAFKKTRLVMMTDNETALVYAMGKTPTGTTPWIGWRRDSGANTHWDTGMTTAKQNAVANRWKVAPVVMEAYGGTGVTPSLMPTQVATWHVAMIGNGNLGSDTWSSFSSTDQNYFLTAGHNAGYRFVLTNVTIPQALVPGGGFTVAAQWKNVGNAPAYEPFTVTYQLRSGTTVVAEWASGLDLEDANAITSTASTYNDSFVVPSTVAPGTYSFAVIVPSLDGSRDPLKLAITNAQASDGSYTLGNVTIGANNYSATIDDFDDGNVTSPAWTTSANTGATVSVTAQAVNQYEAASPDGSAYFSIIDFGSVATWKYAVLNRGTATFGSSWSANGVNAIRFYLKGSTANGSITSDSQVKFQLREGDTGDRWSFNIGYAVRDNSTGWTTITVPFSSLYSDGNASGATFNLSAIDQIRFFDNSAAIPIKIRVDRIEAFHQ